MSKQEDTEKTTRAANTSGTKVRRRRRKNPEDVKMHLRIPRDIHAECAEEADRLGMSITAIMLERLSATSNQKTKTELTRLVSEVAGYGEPVLRPALEALWSTDETHRMRCIRDALHAARDVREA